MKRSDVAHIAKLARLTMSEQEIEKFTKQLSAILEHAKMLEEVDTEGVEPIAQITGLQNVQEEDRVESCKGEALIKCTPQAIQNNMIKVRNIF